MRFPKGNLVKVLQSQQQHQSGLHCSNRLAHTITTVKLQGGFSKKKTCIRMLNNLQLGQWFNFQHYTQKHAVKTMLWWFKETPLTLLK